jgi:hypothetical protein
MFPLAEYQRLVCQMVVDATVGRCLHTSILVFETVYIPLVLTPFWHARYPDAVKSRNDITTSLYEFHIGIYRIL